MYKTIFGRLKKICDEIGFQKKKNLDQLNSILQNHHYKNVDG